jgi:hypothetical protein
MGFAVMLLGAASIAAAGGTSGLDAGSGPSTAGVTPMGNGAELRGATLIDSSVALVDQRVVTLSQLDQEARLAFVTHGAMDEANGPLDAAKRRAALDYLINQMLLDDEAARLQVFEVSDQESAEQQRVLQAHFASPAAFRAFLARFDITPEVLDQSVRRRMRAERYLADRLQQVDVNPTAEARKDLTIQVETLLASVRARHDVRVLTDFAAEASAVAPRSTPSNRPDGDGGHAHTWGQIR